MSKFFGFLKAKKWLAVILACVGVGIIGVAGFAIYTATHADIMPNVRVENLALGGMTREEAIEAMGAIDEEYGASTFNITAADTITPVVGKELNVRLDKEAVADEAIKVGHEGNLWQRMLATAKTLTSGHEIAPVVVLDEDLLGVIIERVSAANVEPQDATFRVEKDQLILTPPVDGKHFDIEALKTRIREKFQEKDYGDMVLTMEPWEAKPINLDEVYAEVHTEAKDAVIETKDGKKVLTPHVVGVDFDLAAAKEKLAQTPDEEIRITLTLTQPKVTTASLQSSNELFGHTLSKVTTRYSAKKPTVSAMSNLQRN
ncbi:MAG: peptidoglycan binding domain-containing protein [Oscillospiraceae bacterium]|nr:peptidoglycan binding domain-containing protein [Oscillospiraceae bacterium]